MSVKYLTFAMKAETESPLLKLVLIILSDRADENGVVRMTNKELADKCQITEQTAQRAKRKLREMSLIEVVESSDKANWLGKAYKITPYANRKF